MNITNLRLRYTHIFLICLLVTNFYTMSRSLSNGFLMLPKNFLNRQILISIFTNLRLALGDHVFLQGIVGKEGWMEYTEDRNLDDYQNTMVIPQKTLKKIQLKIQKLNDELRKKNITLLIVIAPNKATIYPDKLPDEIRKIGKESNLDRFSAYLKQHGPDVLLDLRPVLLNERKKQDVFYSTDTHWNTYGAFAGYTEIIKKLAKTYPELTPKTINDFDIQFEEPKILDITTLIGASNIRHPKVLFIPKQDNLKWAIFNDETKIPMQVATTPDENLPTALMYLDSFGTGPKAFLPRSFSRTTFIQNNSQYPDLLTLQTIDLIHPDIVILEFVERSFSNQRMDILLNKLLSTQ